MIKKWKIVFHWEKKVEAENEFEAIEEAQIYFDEDRANADDIDNWEAQEIKDRKKEVNPSKRSDKC